MTLGLRSRVEKNSDIIHVSLGDGTVVLLGSDGLNYFVLGETGSRIWEKLDTTLTLQSLCDSLMSDFDVDETTCRAETIAFIETLLSHGFVNIVSRDSRID